MTGTRLLLSACLFASALAFVPAAPGLGFFNRKSRADAPKVRQLLDTLRANPDEKRRLAAVTELREFDPRVHGDIVPGLLAALKKDAAAGVRAAAAEILGEVKPISPANGAALEAALETDPSDAVRVAARNALWEYHLSGYRSPIGVERLAAGQTDEPPLARRPARPTPPPPPEAKVEVAVVPVARPPDRTPRPGWPPLPALVAPPKPDAARWLPSIPLPVETEPRLAPALPVGVALPPPTVLVPTITTVSAAPPPILNLTSEPDLARPSAAPPPPTLTAVREPGPRTGRFEGRLPGSRLLDGVRPPPEVAPAPRVVFVPPVPPVGFSPVFDLPPVSLPPSATPPAGGAISE